MAPSSGSSPSSNDISGNTFLNNGYYGVSIVSGTNNTVRNNQFVNSGVGIEADDFSQALINNVIANNTIRNDGNGRIGGIFLRQGGEPSGFNYAQNTISDNSVSGSGTIFWQGGMSPGNNSCTNGCQLR
jgi:parallel beta-helix repeat protein